MGRRVFERCFWGPLHNRENQAIIYNSRFPTIQRCYVAEHQIAIIEVAGLAARIQAAAKYPNEVFPRGES